MVTEEIHIKTDQDSEQIQRIPIIRSFNRFISNQIYGTKPPFGIIFNTSCKGYEKGYCYKNIGAMVFIIIERIGLK